MPTPKYVFSPGDHVIVRTWDSMMEEYGPDPYGDIAVHPNKLSFCSWHETFLRQRVYCCQNRS